MDTAEETEGDASDELIGMLEVVSQVLTDENHLWEEFSCCVCLGYHFLERERNREERERERDEGWSGGNFKRLPKTSCADLPCTTRGASEPCGPLMEAHNELW